MHDSLVQRNTSLIYLRTKQLAHDITQPERQNNLVEPSEITYQSRSAITHLSLKSSRNEQAKLKTLENIKY